MSIEERKKDHIQICLDAPVEKGQRYIQAMKFEHEALPDLNFDDISTQTKFLDRVVHAPFFIGSMTGGAKEATKINANLAIAAEERNIVMGLGSQRAMLEKEELVSTFNVRKYAKNAFIFANIGAVQLNYGVDVDGCKKIVDVVGADALCFHINPLQEAIQEGGDRNFSGLLQKMENVVKDMHVPVIVKEVGAGISGKQARQLKDIGVAAVDVAGVGGTSWAFIEAERKMHEKRVGDIFGDWGIPTHYALAECRDIQDLFLIAGGGVRTGLDVAKYVALGAQSCSMALPFLKAAMVSAEEVVKLIDLLTYELKIAMFATGCRNIEELAKKKLYIYDARGRKAVN